MASFFGEIVPDISRAVDDDDDDDDVEYIPSPIKVQWNDIVDKEMKSLGHLSCTQVVIAIGTAATGFVQTFIVAGQETELLGSVISEAETDNKVMKPSVESNCKLIRIKQKPEVMLVQCTTEILPEQTFTFTQQCFGCLKQSVKVVVLSSCLTSQHRSENRPNAPFFRCLHTNTHTEKPLYPFLEQPNTVPGLAAQVLSHCEILKKDAVLYMCYTDVLSLDSHTIKAFLNLRKGGILKTLIVDNPNAEEELGNLVCLHSSHNTLYI